MSFLDLSEKEQFDKDLENSLKAKILRDSESVDNLDLNCKLCGDKILEIKRFQNKRYQHVCLCGKCQFTIHKWGG